jgi:hypothetical protein
MGILLGIPLSQKKHAQSSSDGPELLFGVWCYLFIDGMKNPSHEISQKARIVLFFAYKDYLHY